MTLTMLGTGHALVTECYNTCFVLHENNEYFMVDGGGGSQLLHQLKHAHIDWSKIRDIFVTHSHIDHLTGIIWMMRMICQSMCHGSYTGEAHIYAHEEVISTLKKIGKMLLLPQEAAFFDKRLYFILVHDGEQRELLHRTVTFFDIQSVKTKQFGFCMELGNGKKLTCCGDEPFHECTRQYAENSTWLLHEAFCLYAQADVFQPYEKQHSTVKDACECAQQLNIQNLLLYHTEDQNIQNRKALYLAEGQQYYTGKLFIPDDLETLEIL